MTPPGSPSSPSGSRAWSTDRRGLPSTPSHFPRDRRHPQEYDRLGSSLEERSQGSRPIVLVLRPHMSRLLWQIGDSSARRYWRHLGASSHHPPTQRSSPPRRGRQTPTPLPWAVFVRSKRSKRRPDASRRR